MNRVVSIVLALIMAFAWYPTAVSAAEPNITIVSSQVNADGSFEVIGRVEGVEVGTQVSFIMCSEDVFDSTGHIVESKFSNDKIAYIDQVGTGNNGTFIVQGAVSYEWRGETVRFAGASSYGGYYTGTLYIASDPPGIEVVKNNSVLYGRDIYLVTGNYYTANNIATSIKEGGNRIYFKIGNVWYDLLDEDAVDNSYLVIENAIKDTEVEKCEPRYYYNETKQIVLKGGI